MLPVKLKDIVQLNLYSIVKMVINEAGLGGFEPPTFGLEARRYILAKPQAQ